MSMTIQEPGMRDFSLPMEPKRFRLDPDVFEAPAIIAAGTLKRIVSLYGSAGEVTTENSGDTLDKVAEAFRLLMPGPHGERFAARMLSDGGPDDPPPIDLRRQALPVLMWLYEEYGLRPTQPSSGSAGGSTDGTDTTQNGGTGSTAGATPTDSETTSP